jgi:hypothetical protein
MLLPRFGQGDRVKRIGLNQLNFIGTIRQVIPPAGIAALINKIAAGDQDTAVNLVRDMYNRDNEFHHNYAYIVEPESSPGPATFEEAEYIVPGITIDQYHLLMKGRKYLIIDSDLIDWESSS